MDFAILIVVLIVLAGIVYLILTRRSRNSVKFAPIAPLLEPSMDVQPQVVNRMVSTSRPKPAPLSFQQQIAHAVNAMKVSQHISWRWATDELKKAGFDYRRSDGKRMRRSHMSKQFKMAAQRLQHLERKLESVTVSAASDGVAIFSCPLPFKGVAQQWTKRLGQKATIFTTQTHFCVVFNQPKKVEVKLVAAATAKQWVGYQPVPVKGIGKSEYMPIMRSLLAA